MEYSQTLNFHFLSLLKFMYMGICYWHNNIAHICNRQVVNIVMLKLRKCVELVSDQFTTICFSSPFQIHCRCYTPSYSPSEFLKIHLKYKENRTFIYLSIHTGCFEICALFRPSSFRPITEKPVSASVCNRFVLR